MISQVIAAANFTGGNPATLQKLRNVTLSRTNTGIYALTIGQGGIDSSDADYRVVITSSAAGTTAKLVDTSDTVKTLTVVDSAFAATDTFAIAIVLAKLAPPI